MYDWLCFHSWWLDCQLESYFVTYGDFVYYKTEYMTLTKAEKEGICMKGLVSDLGLNHDQAIVYCDSSSAIRLAKDQVHHERTKHIDVKLHFLRSGKRIKMNKVGTADNPIDMFTKSVLHNKFQHCLDLLNIRIC